ncbi:MAG: hypothetical protein M3308_10095, partial [Actinomycetota bacterium]|nr:hypothetical protein [Actinomycetota bacterium]
DHRARPDVSTGLWAGESGIPADPPVDPVSSGFAGLRGWFSNGIPRLIPNMIPRMHPRRNHPQALMIFVLADRWLRLGRVEIQWAGSGVRRSVKISIAGTTGPARGRVSRHREPP